MNKFNNLYNKILQEMTTGTAFGPSQAQAPVTGQSSDFYAPGDSRNLFGGGKKWKPKKDKKKKLNGEAQPLLPIQRRTFPGGM